MRRKIFVFLLATLLPLLAVFLIMNSGVTAQDDAPQALGNDEGAAIVNEAIIPEKFQPDPGAVVGGGTSTVYFSPQDSNSTNTVIFLYNTSQTVANVDIEGFGFAGESTVSQTVGVPAEGALRISADTLVISPEPPPSWLDNVAYVNFADNTAYATLQLPAGVRAEGWVVWNGMETFDPRADVERVPLRFSVDPPTVFLPLIPQNAP
ncbi:MAG: hypothetical protein ACOC9Z_00260 [Chloroflexota bacterium]